MFDGEEVVSGHCACSAIISSLEVSMNNIEKMNGAIVHIDGDAFFASCEQAMRPELRGRPVATGSERGIISSASYEAKKFGVKRGVPPWEAKKMCPGLVFLHSDYSVYESFSRRMFAVMRRFTPVVEEYSIDEGFADVTGFTKLYRCSYFEIARRMKVAIEQELEITVSAGVSSSKVLAKVGSKLRKPSGCVEIFGEQIERILREVPVGNLWGIGRKMTEKLERCGVYTALDFAQKGEGFVRMHFAKPQWELWRELHGESVYPVVDLAKTGQGSISRTRTFRPSSSDRRFLWAQLMSHLEDVCRRARHYGQVASGLSVFLKTQQFQYASIDMKLAKPSAFPVDMIEQMRGMFMRAFQRGAVYRATGVTLVGLRREIVMQERQFSLFENASAIFQREEKRANMYRVSDAITAKMGREALFLGGSMEPSTGVEPATYPLPWGCSTTELRRLGRGSARGV